jgi:HEAT repeat protein
MYLQSLEDSNDEEYRETELLVYRAIGLKKDKRYVDMLRQLLQDSRTAFRGVAALAIARINGSKEVATLTKAYEESGSPWERIMTGLGLLLIRSPESYDILGHLQNDLTIVSQEYEPQLSDWRFRTDTLSILKNIHKPLATQIANSWESVYTSG